MLKDGSMRYWRLWLPLVVSCLFATGCSLVRFGYDFFPTWALWQIDGYLGLDVEQRLIARRRLTQLHDWHRQGQLPGYVEFIQSFKKRAPTSLTEQDAKQVREAILSSWPPLAAQLAPGLAEVLLTVQPSQVVQLRKEFAKANRKIRAEYLPSDRLAARAKRQLERIDYFLGDLNEPQKQQLRALSDAAPASEEDRLAEREARQQRFLVLLERLISERPEPSQAEQLSRDYLLSMWTSADRQRQTRLDASSRANDAMTVTIVAQATPEQQRHMATRLTDWEQTLSQLAGATR